MPSYSQYLISETIDFNNDTGQSVVYTFAGARSKMAEIAAFYQQAGLDTPIGYGYHTSLHEAAGVVLLTVRIPDDILYTEKWNLASSPESIPIWRDPKLRTYLPSFAGLDFTDTTGATARAFAWRVMLLNRTANSVASGVSEGSIFQNTTPPTGTADLGTLTQAEFEVILQIVREGAYTEWKRPVLKRQRYIPSINLSNRTRLVGQPLLYSLSGIANVFGIPDDIYDQAVTAYDGLPTAYPKTIWSWKLGRDDSEGVVGAAKVLECKEWTFGCWSTITNTFVE